MNNQDFVTLNKIQNLSFRIKSITESIKKNIFWNSTTKGKHKIKSLDYKK